MLFVLGVSEPFKGVWGATKESDVESLFELLKYELLLNTWLVPYSVLVFASLTESDFLSFYWFYIWDFHSSKVYLSCLEGHPW